MAARSDDFAGGTAHGAPSGLTQPAEARGREARSDVKDGPPMEGSRAPGPATESAKGPNKAARARSLAPRLIVALAVGAALIAGALWWLDARHYESTDDAYIAARPVAITSRISAAVTRVLVTDDEHVAAGAPLVELDRRTVLAVAHQAEARLAAARADVVTLLARIDAQHAAVDQSSEEATQAQAGLTFAQSENVRAQALLKQGTGTRQRADQTATDLTQRTAALAAAQQGVVAAQKQLAVLEAELESARAAERLAAASLEEANVDVDHARILAPSAGRVTKLGAAVGTYAQPGQSLMMFVPDDLWIRANFKETQLTDMRPGQPATVRIDAYPGKRFDAHVESLQAGSGDAFSLLPAENATGNFVKIVQRVPVKIVFDEPPGVYLGPGMSVVPRVRVR